MSRPEMKKSRFMEWPGKVIPKFIDSPSALTAGTVMCAPSCQHNAEDRRLAMAARLSGPHIDAMFKLIKATHSIGIHIIGDRRSASFDGVLQDFAQGQTQPFQLGLGQSFRALAGSNAGMKEALVGIDVAHAR